MIPPPKRAHWGELGIHFPPFHLSMGYGGSSQALGQPPEPSWLGRGAPGVSGGSGGRGRSFPQCSHRNVFPLENLTPPTGMVPPHGRAGGMRGQTPRCRTPPLPFQQKSGRPPPSACASCPFLLIPPKGSSRNTCPRGPSAPPCFCTDMRAFTATLALHFTSNADYAAA